MMDMKLQIAPSILSADFGHLNEEIASIEPYSEILHFDVMDGLFVPNLSFGAPVLACLKTSLQKQCHLMVQNPEARLQEFKDAGADMVIVHVEATQDLPALLQSIRALGMEAGVSLKPSTPVEALEAVVDEVDQVLVMSVEPGFGGQAFLPSALDKIRALRARRSDLNIAVDGGINAQTAPLAREAGANILIAGSYIFKAANRQEAIALLR